MKNRLLSAAIGDICGMPYEFEGRTKDMTAVDLLNPQNDYTDDTVCTFAVAEALLHGLDIGATLRERCREDFDRGYGGRFLGWLMAPELQPAYDSFGNGSAMRVASAGFMGTTAEQCSEFAAATAMPTHNHPEGVKGAEAIALAIFYARRGFSKEEIKAKTLDCFYPEWSHRTYDDIKPDYHFDETCQLTVPAALISFLESEDYAHCLKLSIALGGDADTLAAIAGPVAYAFYKEMPEELIANAKRKLPAWMLALNDEFDAYCDSRCVDYDYSDRPDDTPDMITALRADEVFVFGSNLAGMHAGGAANVAVECFGAVWGQGVGMQGQSYAIPTMHGGVEVIKPYVDEFIAYAQAHPEKYFYVTRIGCGIAGFSDEEIAPLFIETKRQPNVALPASFRRLYTED